MVSKKNKIAYLVDISLTVRVVLDDDIDPEMDPEFDEAVIKKVRQKLAEEGDSAITENITDYNEDLEVPYDPETED